MTDYKYYFLARFNMALDFTLALEIHVAIKYFQRLIQRYRGFNISVDGSTHHAEVLLLLLVPAGLGLALLVEAVFGLDLTQVFCLLAALLCPGLVSTVEIFGFRAGG